MENPRLLKLKIEDKLETLEKIKDADLSYDALENPSTLLEHYKEELMFFEKGKRYFIRLIDKPRLFEEEEEDFEGLKDFYLNSYPALELNLMRIIGILEEKKAIKEKP